MRVTQKQLRETVERLQRAHFNIAIHWAYGQPRCTTMYEGRDLSPRLPMREMAMWLDGFEAGATAEEHRQRVLSAMDGN